VSSRYPWAGQPLQDVEFPAGSLVGAILRGDRVIIPRGRDSLRIGDRVIVFVLPEVVHQVEAIFA